MKLVPKAIELACCVFKLEGLLIEKACEHEALVGRVREHDHEEDTALILRMARSWWAPFSSLPAAAA